ncbi:hypothetical protein BZA77DRAFT_354365 [Pyronema omphalodes]|nr:hypothetical protein BZA77DRAFT_354365 [Pyronema omphalodes]
MNFTKLREAAPVNPFLCELPTTSADSTRPEGAQLHLPVTGAIPKAFSELNLHPNN